MKQLAAVFVMSWDGMTGIWLLAVSTAVPILPQAIRKAGSLT